MVFSIEKRISNAHFSILQKQVGVFKLLIFLILGFSFLSSAVAAPLAEEYDNEKREVITPFQLRERQNLYEDLFKRSAGLFWGPVYIGNLKLYLTNPHDGYAGPKFPNANHVNFHVDKRDPGPRNTYSAVVNLHIVKYSQGGSACLYIWDSVTEKVVFDKCFDDFINAIREGVAAAKSFVDVLLQNADAIAYIVVIAAVVVALGAALASLGVVAVA